MNTVPLQKKLAVARQWWRTTRILRGTAWAIFAVALLALVCYRVDTRLVLSTSARLMWRTSILASGAVLFIGSVVFAYLKRLTDASLAATVERRFPELKERLLTVIELGPTLMLGAGNYGFSQPLTVKLADETSRVAEPMDFRRAVDTRSVRNAWLAALIAVSMLFGQRLAAPQSFDNWVNRIRNPRADVPVWANTRVWVNPSRSLLPTGDGVDITVTTRGVPASRVTLFTRPAGDKTSVWKMVSLETAKPEFDTPPSSTSGGPKPEPQPDAFQFTHHISALSGSIDVYAAANDGRSNDKTILVEPRPALINVKLTMKFPSYMHRAAQVIPQSTGSIAAPAGTDVEIDGTANKPLTTAQFKLDRNPAVTWATKAETTHGAISVRKDGSYTLDLEDTHGFTGAQPSPRFEIHSIPDLPPTVTITRPSTDIDLVPDGSVPLVANATDDYGVTSVRLAYDRQQSDQMARTGAAALKTVSRGVLPLPSTGVSTQVNVAQRWHIGDLKAHPGDTIKYQLDAVDNDNLNGPHVGHSNVLNIHIRSLIEMQRKLKDDLDEEARALEQLRKSQIQAQHELHQARVKHDTAALNHAQEAQRAVADEAKAITQRVATISSQLENNNLATKSELARRESAQQTLDNVAQQLTPQAADAVQHAAAAQTNKADQAQSISHADHQETEARKAIEKAQDLLTRTPAPEQLAAEAKRLATEQERLADTSRSLSEGIKEQRQQTNSKQLSPELQIGIQTARQQQDQANQDTQRLERQLNQAATAAEERGQTKQAEALRKAENALKQANTQAQQAAAEQNLAQAHPEKAAPEQDRAAAALEKAAQAAQRVASDNPDAASAAEQLERAAQQLHELAKQQQDVAAKTNQSQSSQQNRDLAAQEKNIQAQAEQQQQNVAGSNKAQQSLQQAQQNLNQSAQQLSQNQARQAHQPAQSAAQNLENAAKQAENAAQQIRQEQAANELAERVERLAQVQSALKNQTERLQNTRQQRPLNNNEKGELGQVAARQQNVEQEAQTLAEQFPSPAFQKALQNAARQAHPATQNLNPANGTQPDTGQQTQAAQARAAQTLDTVAQALKQQAQAGKDPQQQNQDQQSQLTPQQAQQAEAIGELQLAQGMQQQVRQGTGQLEQTRRNQPLNANQAEQARQLAQDQQETKAVTNHAQEALSDLPGVPEALNQAGQHMEQSKNGLSEQRTGQPTQEHQNSALQQLAQAQQKAQQAMQQQQQQQQAQQQAKQGAPQPGKQPGNEPNHKPFTRLENPGNGGTRTSPQQSNGKFADLSQRAQRTMREGQQEKVPAEYQDLVNRYYKSLAEKKR